MINRFLVFPLFLILFIFLFLSESNELPLDEKLQKSMELVGVKEARLQKLYGQGVKIGIIDTGIDFNHPDLGYSKLKKVEDGFNFVNPDKKPMDVNGHGTEVAGIIAANGNFDGIAPESELFSYKVSNNGEHVSSDYIVKAIHHAIQDGVNIINISLGVNKTNNEIDSAIDDAFRKGIVVVVAAGNNGPQLDTIGSPGMDIHAITVGASYNNITSSLVATLEVGKKQYNVLPMVGTKILSSPVIGKIVYGGYGRINDLKGIDVKNSILLEERGSDIKGEKIYFAQKEQNAANMGAKALIVFNNKTGIFFGELKQPNRTSYTPRIPVISMSKNDGLALKEILQSNPTGQLNIFYHPDFVAPFSSRGPVSPFYIKPDLVAPGVFVNTTTLDGKYNLTSGTSIAAPHVTGAAAILLQKYPKLDPSSIASLIATTTDPITDPYGKLLPINAVGSGRLNITRALESNLIINPHSLVFTPSFDDRVQTKSLYLKSLDGSSIPPLNVTFVANETGIGFDYSVKKDVLNMKITDSRKTEGTSEGFIVIMGDGTTYRIPVIIHLTKGTLMVYAKDGSLYYSLNYPDKWSYAKITFIQAGTDNERINAIIPNQTKTLPIYEKGQYWILANIKTKDRTDEAYKTITVNQVVQKNILDTEDNFGIPVKDLEIISFVLVLALSVSWFYSKKISKFRSSF